MTQSAVICSQHSYLKAIVLPPTVNITTKKRVLLSYGVDIDAVAGWLGSYGGVDSSDDISRGLFAGHVGTRCILKVFEKYDIKATWFIPATPSRPSPTNAPHPRRDRPARLLAREPHQHVPPAEHDVLDHSYKLLTQFCNGKPPRRIVAP